ncbi:hypothetical protein F2Q68_00021681 [Brassica cretica]|uniref:Uncharacterized protein n=1 Tax=Brassica cretica TaxID=69181 RepID=A0A8S9FX13_BRACR|nr:hypothetical protein F2Q68_00021681 [Brassica cretica]
MQQRKSSSGGSQKNRSSSGGSKKNITSSGGSKQKTHVTHLKTITVAEETIAEDGSCLKPEIGVPELIAIAGAPFQALWRERVAGFLSVAWKTSLVSKLFFGARLQVKPALMWGGNSSIDSSASFFRWSMMVTSARFSCFVPSFLHQSALVFCCYALVVIALLGDHVS